MVIHRVNLGFNEFGESMLSFPESVKAGTADDFLLEPFWHIWSFFAPDKNIDFVDLGEAEEKFFEKNLAEEAGRTRYKDPFPRIIIF